MTWLICLAVYVVLEMLLIAKMKKDYLLPEENWSLLFVGELLREPRAVFIAMSITFVPLLAFSIGLMISEQCGFFTLVH